MSILDDFLDQVENLEPGLFRVLKGEQAVKELETLRRGFEMMKRQAHSPIAAAKQLRAIPSNKRSEASRENGKKGGRKRRCHECGIEIKPGDSWERHSYGKGRYVYCGNCGERIRQEQFETDRMEDRRYP